jgi:hypothetical protein
MRFFYACGRDNFGNFEVQDTTDMSSALRLEKCNPRRFEPGGSILCIFLFYSSASGSKRDNSRSIWGTPRAPEGMCNAVAWNLALRRGKEIARWISIAKRFS